MKINEILSKIPFDSQNEYQNLDLDDIFYDSRNYKKNSLYVCLNGFTFDGHSYAQAMYDKGTRFFAAEHALFLPSDATVFICKNTRKFLALASANLFNNPSKKLFTVAITGTKGKTSTSFMLKNILEQTSKKVGIIGTTGIIFNDTHIESDNSTPESYLLHKYMRDMLDSGIDTLVMEASSQGFKMDRTYGINFDIGIFTNLSPDHIGESEHKDFDEYLNCKKMLFSQCITGFFNCDDENFINISSNCTCKMITFGKNKNANVKYSNDAYFSENGKLFSSFDISFQAETYHFKIPLLGEISVYNSACAAAAACYLGISFKDIERGLCKTRIIGRNEIVPIPLDFTVIIDYAHN
ncbi:MAG: Mur ligase family protein, partial [Clostridia bacterium]